MACVATQCAHRVVVGIVLEEWGASSSLDVVKVHLKSSPCIRITVGSGCG